LVTETFQSFVSQFYGKLGLRFQLAITVFLACIFKHSDQKDLIFSVISKTFQAMTEKTESSYGITMEKQLLDGSFGAMMQSY